MLITDPKSSAVGCVRVSTDMQAQAYGPDRQRQEIEREAARSSLSIVHWVEEAVSGANHDRAAENQYYDLARQHPGLNFVFSHPNRVGRHIEVTVGIARQLHRLGATVWIAGLGTLRDARNWRYYLRDAAEAETDYANVVSQLVTGKRSKAMSGRWAHGMTPWGYTLARDQRGRSTLPEPDPALVPAIERLAQLSEHHGQTRVMEIMREEGHPAPTAAGWTRRTVHNLITNERYTGRALFQGITLEYPAIIPREQWERIQARRATRKRESGPRSEALLWSGHVRCEHCGAALGRQVQRGPYNTYTYYKCWRAGKAASRRSDTQHCPQRHWRPEEINEVWWAALTAELTSPAALEKVSQITAAPAPTEPPPARVVELEAAIARAWEPYAAGHVPQAIAERLAAPYVAELDKLRAEYAPAPQSPQDWEATAARFREMLERPLMFMERREILDLLDVRLYVSREGTTRLLFNIP